MFLTDFIEEKGPKGTERALALDEKTGKILWTYEWPADYGGILWPVGPRATPTVDGDRVYILGVNGKLFCLKAATGQIVWKKDYDGWQQNNANRPLEAYNIPTSVADPGPDGVYGNGDDGAAVAAFNLNNTTLPSNNIATNVDGYEGTYKTLEFSANKRYSNRWSMNASFSRTWTAQYGNLYFNNRFGTAVAVGRVGGIGSPYAGAWALESGPSQVFVMLAVTLTLVFAALAAVRNHIPSSFTLRAPRPMAEARQ